MLENILPTHQYEPVSLLFNGLISSVVLQTIADCAVVNIVLFPLMMCPCGPIHNALICTGVSTSGATAKTQNIFMEVPEYTDLFRGRDTAGLGSGTVERTNYNGALL